jgi:hypothetical protein
MTNKKIRLWKNKRGDYVLIDFWAIIVFAIILIIFLLLFLITRNQTTQNVNSEFAEKDAQFILDAFLRAPYLKDNSKTLAQVIAEDVAKDNFENTKASANYFFTNIQCYNHMRIESIKIVIIGDNDDSISVDVPSDSITEDRSCFKNYGETAIDLPSTAETIIPSLNNHPITVRVVVDFDTVTTSYSDSG